MFDKLIYEHVTDQYGRKCGYLGQMFFDGVLPISAIAAIGYLMGRNSIFDAAAAAVINKFIFLIAIPALNFKMIANAPINDFDWQLLIGFFISELSLYLISFLVVRKIMRRETKEAILIGLAVSMGNHILFVLPIAVALFGEQATQQIIGIIALDTIILFGGTIVIMEGLSSSTFSFAVLTKRILRNPTLLALFFGIPFGLMSVDIPHGLNVFLRFTSNLAAPCALFSLGIVLSQIKISNYIRLSTSMSMLKLVGHPLIAWVVLSGLFGFDLTGSKMAMMVAAAPCGAMGFVLALNYGVRTDVIAPTILFTTIGSLASVTIAASI
jgi:malonate transporter